MMQEISKDDRGRAELFVETLRSIDEKLMEDVYKVLRKNEVKEDIKRFLAKESDALNGLPKEQIPDVIDAAAERIIFDDDFDYDRLDDEYTGIIINALDDVTTADIDPWENIYPMAMAL